MAKILMTFFVIVCIIILISIKLRFSLHMFQQNRYRLDRYWHWSYQYVRANFKTIVLNNIVFFLILLIQLIPFYFLEIITCILLCFETVKAIKLQMIKKYVISFKYTNRIKRLILCCSLIYLIIIIFLIRKEFYYTNFLIALLVLSTPIIMIGSAIIVYPIEEQIKKAYVKKARIRLNQSACEIIGISGSYGKTSVKHIIYKLLSEHYDTLMTPHSYNNKMGISMCINQSMNAMYEYFVCEMGADHVNEIQELMAFVQPQYAIVCSIGPAHLQTFSTMENIIKEKMKMIECLYPEGVGIINIDNEFIQSYQIRNKCRIITIGKQPNADYRIANINYNHEGSSFTIFFQKTRCDFTTKLLGEHNISNITCGIALAHTIGLSFEIIKKSVKEIPFIEHRLALTVGSNYHILDDAYNSNPIGAKMALDVLKSMPNKRILVTPGFLELKDYEESAHFEFAANMVESCDFVILVGKHQCRYISKALDKLNYQKYLIVDNIQLAFNFLESFAQKEDCVLFENDLPDAFNY